MKTLKLLWFFLFVMSLQMLVLPGARAQANSAAVAAYPTKTVRVVVPFAPGGALDTLARLISSKLAERFGQAFVVDNKPGAANMIGNDVVAKAAPDGFTLLFAAAPIALNTALGIKTPYDVQKDLTPISLVASAGVIVLVHPSAPYKTMQDIIDASKKEANGLNYATAGVGSMPHLLGETWNLKGNGKLTHIGYKGSAQALQDVMSGTVKVFIDGYIPSGVQVENGKLRAIAYGGQKRSELMPNVPTTAEQGFPDIVGGGFFGLLAPASTPAGIIDKLHTAVKEIVQQPEVRERLIKQGYEVHASTPAEYSAYIRQQIERFIPVVKAAGIKPE